MLKWKKYPKRAVHDEAMKTPEIYTKREPTYGKKGPERWRQEFNKRSHSENPAYYSLTQTFRSCQSILNNATTEFRIKGNNKKLIKL